MNEPCSWTGVISLLCTIGLWQTLGPFASCISKAGSILGYSKSHRRDVSARDIKRIKKTSVQYSTPLRSIRPLEAKKSY